MQSIADAGADGDVVRLPPALIQPISSDDVASAVGRAAVGEPRNGIVEVAGPDEYRLDELIRDMLARRDDPRTVIADPRARYYGISPSERVLLPGPGALIAATRFDTWFERQLARA
jgi:uncharacterized protein YbjT (DUF2867 family)